VLVDNIFESRHSSERQSSISVVNFVVDFLKLELVELSLLRIGVLEVLVESKWLGEAVDADTRRVFHVFDRLQIASKLMVHEPNNLLPTGEELAPADAVDGKGQAVVGVVLNFFEFETVHTVFQIIF
jgi:hypothetical protein